MTIYTVCFKYPDRPEYKILLEVFRKSVKHHMPDVNFVSVEPIPPPYERHRVPGYLDNTFKLDLWVKFFNETNDNILFMDCDMLALRNGEHAFNVPFDVAYTAIKQPYKAKINGGVIMTRPTEEAYEFLNELLDVNNRMFKDVDFHEKWRTEKGYAGINQAAMGCVLETGINGAKVHKYMTREWNAIDRDLQDIDNSTVFVHMKSKIRKLVLQGHKPVGVFKNTMKEWYINNGR
jgi:hypothetical protein